MTVTKDCLSVMIASILLTVSLACAEPLQGKTGEEAGNGWQSSWLDLTSPISFKKGVRLQLNLQGSAENVVVRLLPADTPPDSSTGIEGKVRKVPSNGPLEVTLERDHPNVKQISVHGGNEAWGIKLGGNNGNVTLISVERISP